MKRWDGSTGEIVLLSILSVFVPPLGIPLLIMTLVRRNRRLKEGYAAEIGLTRKKTA